MALKLTRNIFQIKELREGDKCAYQDGVLTVNYDELKQAAQPYMRNVEKIWFEVCRPGENARIIHILDVIYPMAKQEKPGNWGGGEYPGVLNYPYTCGSGVTNCLEGLSVMECWAMPWDEQSTSSGLQYARDCVVQTQGFYSNWTPFPKMINLIINYEMARGKSAEEYDNDIRKTAMSIAKYLAELPFGQEPDEVRDYDNTLVEGLPKVALVWQCQNQGTYANTLLYGLPIYDIVPTLLEPTEMLDGAVVGANYAWPAFKCPTYMHVNHPCVEELMRRHGQEINFMGVIFCRSHNPSNWHKDRCSQLCAKIAAQLGCDGLLMAWEGGGNACVDGMLTIQNAEWRGIKAATFTFEFGGKDGSEGLLLVDHVPEADAVVSGGSWERTVQLDPVEVVYGGDTLRLNKESGGWFPKATEAVEFETSVHMLMSGNQTGFSQIACHEY